MLALQVGTTIKYAPALLAINAVACVFCSFLSVLCVLFELWDDWPVFVLPIASVSGIVIALLNCIMVVTDEDPRRPMLISAAILNTAVAIGHATWGIASIAMLYTENRWWLVGMPGLLLASHFGGCALIWARTISCLPKPGCCQACGYDVSGLNTCPECGATPERDDPF